MLCPKCKTELRDSTLRCSNCGMKVQSKCPVCGTLNRVTALKCVSCSHELLRKCSACGAYNLPSSQNCRKCAAPLAVNIPEKTAKKILKQAMATVPTSIQEEIYIQEEPVSNIETTEKNIINATNEIETETTEDIQIHEEENPAPAKTKTEASTLEEDENFAVEEDFSSQVVPEVVPLDEKGQIEIKTSIVNSIINSKNTFCVLVGQEGCGKTHILSEIVQDLAAAKVSALRALATPVTQLSPYGVFQDLFITMGNLPDFFVDGQQKETDFIKGLEQTFGITSNEASELFALLYPVKTAYYEEILHNSDKIKALIKTVFSHIKQNGEMAVIIDDFDLVDVASFELISEMFNEAYFDDNMKLLVTVQSQKNVDALLQATQMPIEKCERFFMRRFTEEEISTYIKGLLNNTIPFSDEFLARIIEASKGQPFYVGQLLLYMNETNSFTLEESKLLFTADESTFEFPSDANGILAKRLQNIKQELPEVYRALVCMAILGEKFNTIMFQAALGLEQKQFEEILNVLATLAFIVPINENYLAVQNAGLWRGLFDLLKKDELFASCSASFLEKISPLRITSVAYKPLCAQNSGNEQAAFESWSQIMRYCSFLGDVNLYVIAQKQCLKLNEALALEEKEKIDTNIKLRLGKLLCESEPALALDYLATILRIDLATENHVDFIDTASYSVIAANKSGNYVAVVNLVDDVVKLLTPPEKYTLEIALINARKVKTMLYLGDFEKLINTIENDIKPPLEDALSQNYTVHNLPISKIFETWLEVNFVLADAYILQGNNKVYNIMSDLEEAIATHGLELEYYKYKLLLTKAFVSAMKGEVTVADSHLAEINANVANIEIDAEFACRFNLIQVLNRFMKQDLSNMKTYLYELVTFANNNGDNLSKNLLKSALGKVLENEGDFVKALEIYNDEIMYFAKEHISVGALLNWYLHADSRLKLSEHDEALSIALHALDVAKIPRINSYYFQVMYKRLLAEIYLIKGDFDAAKMYLEKALLITKKFNLEYFNVELYVWYAKYHIELFKTGKDGGSSPLVSAKKLYEKAINIASKLGLLKRIEEMKQEYQSLLTFAQLKKISLN